VHASFVLKHHADLSSARPAPCLHKPHGAQFSVQPSKICAAKSA
jgi:hypothetical protein